MDNIPIKIEPEIPCCCDAWTKEKHKYACWMCDKPNGRQIKSEGKKHGHKPIQLTKQYKQLKLWNN